MLGVPRPLYRGYSRKGIAVPDEADLLILSNMVLPQTATAIVAIPPALGCVPVTSSLAQFTQCAAAGSGVESAQAGAVDSIIAGMILTHAAPLSLVIGDPAAHAAGLAALQQATAYPGLKFNEARRQLGLQQWQNWSQVAGSSHAAVLSEAYGTPDGAPALVGALAEAARPPHMGGLFSSLLARHIDAVIHADDCWFEREVSWCLSSEQREWVANLTMQQVLRMTTAIAALPAKPLAIHTTAGCHTFHPNSSVCVPTCSGMLSSNTGCSGVATDEQQGHAWLVPVLMAGWVAIMGVLFLHLVSPGGIVQLCRSCFRSKLEQAQQDASRRRLLWKVNRSVHPSVVATLKANASLILTCQQGIPGDVPVVSARLLRLHLLKEDSEHAATCEVLAIVTHAAIICIDKELARVAALAPFDDISCVHLTNLDNAGLMLEMKAGQVLVFSGATQDMFGFGSPAKTVLEAAGIPVKYESPSNAPALLLNGAERCASIAEVNTYALSCVEPSAVGKCLNLTSRDVKRILAAYTESLQITGGAGLSAAAFAHLTGTPLDSPLLDVIWKQHGIGAATIRVMTSNEKRGRVLKFLSVCGGDMPSPGDQVEFDDCRLVAELSTSHNHLGPLAFIALIAILTGSAPKEVQMLWLFSVLDLDHDGTISFDEVRFMLSAAVRELSLDVKSEDLDYTVNLLINKFNVFSFEASAAPPRLLRAASAPTGALGTPVFFPPALPRCKTSAATLETLDPNEFRLFVYGLLSKNLSGGKLLQGQLRLNLPLDENPLNQIADLGGTSRKPRCSEGVSCICSCIGTLVSDFYHTLARDTALSAWVFAVLAAIFGIALSVVQSAAEWSSLGVGLGRSFTIGRMFGHLVSFFAGSMLLVRARSLWAFVQGSPARALVPVTCMRQLHTMFTTIFVAASLGHTGAYFFAFDGSVSVSHQQAALALGKPALEESPGRRTATWAMLLDSWVGASGVALFALVVAAAVLLAASHLHFRRQVRRLAHMAFDACLVGALFHSSQGNSHLWAYVLLPACIYCVDQLLQGRVSGQSVPVLSAKCVGNDAVQLNVTRSQGVEFQSGAFVQIKLPDAGSSTWHPFTIMSAPQEHHLCLVLKRRGEWTGRVLSAVQAMQARGRPGADAFPKGVHIRGPYLPQTAAWPRARHVLLVGEGIGIVPMLATARDYALRLQAAAAGTPHRQFHTASMHVCWLADSEAELRWLQEQLPDTHASGGRLTVDIFITGSAGSPAAKPLQEWLPSLLGLDPTCAHVHFRHPCLRSVLRGAWGDRAAAGDRCHAFVCAPAIIVKETHAAGAALRRAGAQFSGVVVTGCPV